MIKTVSLETAKALKYCPKCNINKPTSDFYRRKPPYKVPSDEFHSYCKSCLIVIRRNFYHNNKDKMIQKRKKYMSVNREDKLKRRAEFRRKARIETINIYGGKCVCCGEKTHEFLAFDHVNGSGNKHRKIVGTSSLIGWLKRNNYPKDFQLLCHNCNMAKGFHGECPHRRKSK